MHGTTADIVQALSDSVVAVLMNTINLFQNWQHRSNENGHSHDQLPGNYHIFEENTMLPSKPSHSRPQQKQNTVSQQSIVTPSPRSPQTSIRSNTMCESNAAAPKTTKSNQVASREPTESEEEAKLCAEVTQYRQRRGELLERYEKLNEQLKRQKLDSFEDLGEHDKEAMKVFIELAQLTEPMPMGEHNIGLFGSTSTGKSTMLNTVLGQTVAETGVGETTTKITPYSGKQFTLWDVPGRNDEVSYLSMEYISFFKGLSRRLILIQATVKENSSMMKLLDAIGLRYAIVLNKFDKVDEEEREQVQKQIRSEVEKLGLKGVENVYFVSAKQPTMFPDWSTLVNYMENC